MSNVTPIIPSLLHDSRGKVIERFFMERCSLKEHLMLEGSSASRADSIAKSEVPAKVLTDSLFRLGRRNPKYGIGSRTKAQRLAAQIIGDEAPIEQQRYRFLQAQGAELNPYRSIADKLAARQAVAA